MNKRELKAKILPLLPERGNTTEDELAVALGEDEAKVTAALSTMKAAALDGIPNGGTQYWRQAA